MRILILTSGRTGLASRCLPLLIQSPSLEVAGVVMAQAGSRRRVLTRKLKKTMRIGVLGALNGVRLRSWYRDETTEDVVAVARRYGVPLVATGVVNCDETRAIFKQLDADLGLSLGNSYIGKSVYSIPRHGMINVHAEILPTFQGALSIIWPIYRGITETGFTIHQIDDHIDTGEILFQEKNPIRFFPTLRATVEHNLAVTRDRVPPALRHVCENYLQLKDTATRQEGGQSFTTPTIRQFIVMCANHARLYRQALAKGEAGK